MCEQRALSWVAEYDDVDDDITSLSISEFVLDEKFQPKSTHCWRVITGKKNKAVYYENEKPRRRNFEFCYQYRKILLEIFGEQKPWNWV